MAKVPIFDQVTELRPEEGPKADEGAYGGQIAAAAVRGSQEIGSSLEALGQALTNQGNKNDEVDTATKLAAFETRQAMQADQIKAQTDPADASSMLPRFQQQYNDDAARTMSTIPASQRPKAQVHFAELGKRYLPEIGAESLRKGTEYGQEAIVKAGGAAAAAAYANPNDVDAQIIRFQSTVDKTSLQPWQKQNLFEKGYEPIIAAAARKRMEQAATEDDANAVQEWYKQKRQQIPTWQGTAVRPPTIGNGVQPSDQAGGLIVPKAKGWQSDRPENVPPPPPKNKLGALFGGFSNSPDGTGPAAVAPNDQAAPGYPSPKVQSATAASAPNAYRPAYSQMSATERDLAIKTAIGEASTDEGRLSVLNTIMNRVQSGRSMYGGNTIQGVITKPGQFTAWDPKYGSPGRLNAIDPNSAEYKHVGELVDLVTQGRVGDNTGGATHFFDPATAAKQGLKRPSWAPAGSALASIEGQEFYAPEGKVMPALTSGGLQGADATQKLTPNEQYLYNQHLHNLITPNGVSQDDGNRATLAPITVEQDGRFYNVPTIVNGKELSNDEALAAATKDGLSKYPNYDNADEAQASLSRMEPFMKSDRDMHRLQTITNPVDLARAMVGKDTPAIAQFLSQVGGQKIDPHYTAWCAAFINSILKQNGMEGSGSLSAKDFLRYGQDTTSNPQKGDIVVMNRAASVDPTLGHAGFYVGPGDKPNTIKIIAGNVNGTVQEYDVPSSRVVGIRRVGPGDAYSGGPANSNNLPSSGVRSVVSASTFEQDMTRIDQLRKQRIRDINSDNKVAQNDMSNNLKNAHEAAQDLGTEPGPGLSEAAITKTTLDPLEAQRHTRMFSIDKDYYTAMKDAPSRSITDLQATAETLNPRFHNGADSKDYAYQKAAYDKAQGVIRNLIVDRANDPAKVADQSEDVAKLIASGAPKEKVIDARIAQQKGVGITNPAPITREEATGLGTKLLNHMLSEDPKFVKQGFQDVLDQADKEYGKYAKQAVEFAIQTTANINPTNAAAVRKAIANYSFQGLPSATQKDLEDKARMSAETVTKALMGNYNLPWTTGLRVGADPPKMSIADPKTGSTMQIDPRDLQNIVSQPNYWKETFDNKYGAGATISVLDNLRQYGPGAGQVQPPAGPTLGGQQIVRPGGSQALDQAQATQYDASGSPLPASSAAATVPPGKPPMAPPMPLDFNKSQELLRNPTPAGIDAFNSFHNRGSAAKEVFDTYLSRPGRSIPGVDNERVKKAAGGLSVP